MTAPTLIFGWGNPSRGDDALGPLFVEHFAELARRHPEWGEVECLTDFQLQVEHALDLQGRRRVLFVDASLDAPAPCSLVRIEAGRDDSFTTHAMSPQALMQVFLQLFGVAPPPCTLLAIRGEQFELGKPPSELATQHLKVATRWAQTWAQRPQVVSRQESSTPAGHHGWCLV